MEVSKLRVDFMNFTKSESLQERVKSDRETPIDISSAKIQLNNNTIIEFINTNEQLLLILNRETGLAPYSHEFIKGIHDAQVLSGFISAISSFIYEVIGFESTQWKTVFGTNSIILVEGGEWSIGVLIAARETSELRSKLRSVVREFEECFEFLRDVEGIQYIFHDFDKYVRRVFVDERITRRTVVAKISDWRDQLSNFRLPSIAFGVSKILLGFDESTTVQEIVDFHKIRIEKVIDILSTAAWHGLVRLTYVPEDHDILSLSERASAVLFSKSNPLEIPANSLRAVARLDGRTPLSKIIDKMSIKEQELLESLGILVNRGLVQRISIERRLVLFNECILSTLMSKGALIIGPKPMRDFFELVSTTNNIDYPWIGRISLSDALHVSCYLEESMTHTDLDDISNTLIYFIEEITKHLTRRCGDLATKRLVETVYIECRENWTHYISDLEK